MEAQKVKKRFAIGWRWFMWLFSAHVVRCATVVIMDKHRHVYTREFLCRLIGDIEIMSRRVVSAVGRRARQCTERTQLISLLVTRSIMRCGLTE